MEEPGPRIELTPLQGAFIHLVTGRRPDCGWLLRERQGGADQVGHRRQALLREREGPGQVRRYDVLLC